MTDSQKLIGHIIEINKMFVSRAVKPGSTVCDATLGNGHDALFLADLCLPGGLVIGFDIQEEAIHNSTKKMQEAGHSHYRFYQDSHCRIDQYCNQADAILFNLGYMPGHSKELITKPDTTLPAIETSLQILNKGGLLSIVCYTGHAGGQQEAASVMDFLSDIDKEKYDVLKIMHTNRSEKAPFLLLVSKKGE